MDDLHAQQPVEAHRVEAHRVEAPGAPPAPRRRRTALFRSLAALAVALLLAGGAGGYAYARTQQHSTAAVSASSPTASEVGTGSNSSTGSSDPEANVGAAIVDVSSTLAQGGVAKGTGMIVTSDGEILTNNHVIDGATAITVRLTSTGRTYSAKLLGYDVGDDVALLTIHASHLPTISTASSSSVTAGDEIVVLGNAGGEDGDPIAADGVVSATDQTITASDGTGSDSETLHGLIEVTADVQEGDSGGATIDASGRVIGMTTAAGSTGFGPMSMTTRAYAIPIDTALDVAHRIEAGDERDGVHLGEHGILGVAVQDSDAGPLVGAVTSDSAAERAGLTEGDVIETVNGQSVGSTTELGDAMAGTHVGDRVQVSWEDARGELHTASLTLRTGIG